MHYTTQTNKLKVDFDYLYINYKDDQTVQGNSEIHDKFMLNLN
jgi:hypothetical protein